jgi:hypothetical protein
MLIIVKQLPPADAPARKKHKPGEVRELIGSSDAARARYADKKLKTIESHMRDVHHGTGMVLLLVAVDVTTLAHYTSCYGDALEPVVRAAADYAIGAARQES